MLQDHYFTDDDIEQIGQISGKGVSSVDVGYVTLFDPKDLVQLNKFYNHIKLARLNNNLERKNELVDYYEQFLSRTQHDKTVCYEYIPEPLQVGYKPDRVVFSGLERLADLATGKSDSTFNYYAIGTGTSPVLPSDVQLDFEEARVSINETGFAESKGSSMVFAGYFPATLPSMSVSESGIFDCFNAPSTMFLRTIYTGSNILPHIFNQTFVAASHFVYQLSV